MLFFTFSTYVDRSILVLIPSPFLCYISGSTNPFIRKGVLRIQERKQQLPSSWFSNPLNDLAVHLTTFAFVVPQVLNLCGGILFALTVRQSALSIAVPLANGVSIATNALTDHFLGEGISLWPGIPGVLLIVAGVILCSF